MFQRVIQNETDGTGRACTLSLLEETIWRGSAEVIRAKEFLQPRVYEGETQEQAQRQQCHS